MDLTLLDFTEGNFIVKDGYVEHRNIKPDTIEAKDFQLKIANRALRQNTLVVLPTGLGKTIIAALVVAEILSKKDSKALILAPTKPLVNQHRKTFKRVLSVDGEMAVFTGSMKPDKRREVWDRSRIIFSTPQIIRNDIKDRYDLNSIDLLVVDEAHRAIGNYAYVPIAKNYNRYGGLILGLTASPGGNKKKIKEVIENLYIKNIEARSRSDEDVREYVKDIEIHWLKTDLAEEQKLIQRPLEELLYEKIGKLQRSGFLSYKPMKYVSKKDLIDVRDSIQKRIGKGKKGYLFGVIHNQNIALHVYNCLELLETQGVKPLKDYLNRLFEKKDLSKAEKSLINDERFKKAYDLVKDVKRSHPKINVLMDVIKKQLNEKSDSLIIVFAQYRDTIDDLTSVLEKLPNVKPVKFIGQASRHGKGLSQDEQIKILSNFKNKLYNVLVASSVAEEGIDIPQVDLVIFYEPIPSEIRAIQRRGRTGRSNIGKVKVLITKDTRDEAYLYAEERREERMHKIIEWLKNLKNDRRIH